jgi:hypothetical protein
MQATSALKAWDRHEPKTDKQWAAEDFAISIGLLRECPYHGQPFQASRERLTAKALAAGLVDPQDPLVQVFAGNTRELMATVERVTRHYGEHCAHCEASEEDNSELD